MITDCTSGQSLISYSSNQPMGHGTLRGRLCSIAMNSKIPTQSREELQVTWVVIIVHGRFEKHLGRTLLSSKFINTARWADFFFLQINEYPDMHGQLWLTSHSAGRSYNKLEASEWSNIFGKRITYISGRGKNPTWNFTSGVAPPPLQNRIPLKYRFWNELHLCFRAKQFFWQTEERQTIRRNLRFAHLRVWEPSNRSLCFI